ncbi:MAG: CRISPR-associated endonuclease Cas1 [Bacteroidetes bacterium]|nr:CRISPR-associated endonuclease Cas1 [Bacteroidota bacterium]
MIIIIEQYNVELHVENECFVISDANHTRSISPLKLDAFLIFKPIHLTSAVILLAVKYQVALVFTDNVGKPIARIQSSKTSNHALIRQQQALFSTSTARISYLHKVLLHKCKGQLSVIYNLEKEIEGSSKFLNYKKKLEQRITNFENNNIVSIEQLRIEEAYIAKLYWHCISIAMRHLMPFSRRSTQGALDEFNAAINYGYGILYNVVESAIIAAGLDSSMGLMHALGYNKLSLVYDLIEPYRPWVDELVTTLFINKSILKLHFMNEGLLFSITKEGKAILIPALVEKLNAKIYYEGKRIKRKDQIYFNVRVLAQFLLNDYKHV